MLERDMALLHRAIAYFLFVSKKLVPLCQRSCHKKPLDLIVKEHLEMHAILLLAFIFFVSCGVLSMGCSKKRK